MLDEINLRLNKHQRLVTCVSEVIYPENYKTKEEFFEKVRSVWAETYKTLNKNEGITEVGGVLPGVDKEKCCDEPVLPEHAAWSWGVILVVLAIILSLYVVCYKQEIVQLPY